MNILINAANSVDGQAMIGRMLQGIVHNLRGPLTAVMGNTEVAELLVQQLRQSAGPTSAETTDTIDRIAELHHTIKRVAGQAESMLAELLSRSREEATSDRRPICLNDVIQEELNLLSSDHAIADSVQRRVSLTPNLPPIHGNVSDFSQVIYNLVKNASDAMALMPLRELTISTDMDEFNQIIQFRDTGSGISPENRSRIFDLYFSTKSATDDAPVMTSGSGIGLYTCAQIVRTYGGEIKVESELGIGSCFTVLIPRQNEVKHQSGDDSRATL